MALKEFFRKYQPVQIYIVLVLTIFYFLIQLVVSHFTHALTLLVDSYHVLCNLIALFGCLVSFKYQDSNEVVSSTVQLTLGPSADNTVSSDNTGSEKTSKRSPREARLINTFGWARIDVLVMLIGCVFLCSLCFSLMLEAAQTLSHISHHDAMHHPLQVLLVGAIGLVLNGFCYLMIGGYTYYQGGFLRVGDSGDITLQKGLTDIMSREHTRAPHTGHFKPRRQGPWEMTRDVLGCVFVMICSIIVYLTDDSVAKFVDPALSIISATLLLAFSYPHMRDAGYILLQTIPNHIDIDILCAELVEAFPNILNVHDIHVWQLTKDKTVSTAHLIFLNAQDYLRCTDRLLEFFYQHGISHVTIQPEFYEAGNRMDLISSKFGSHQCLIRCLKGECTAGNCCPSEESDSLTAVRVTDEEVKTTRDPKPCEVQSIPLREGTSKPLKRLHSSQHFGPRSTSQLQLVTSRPHSQQEYRLFMTNSTPILHLLRTSHTDKKPRIQKAGSMSPRGTHSCVQLPLEDY